jgi:hypothetical protein
MIVTGTALYSDEDVCIILKTVRFNRLVGVYWDDSYITMWTTQRKRMNCSIHFFTSNGYLVYDDSVSKYHQSTEHYDEYVDAEVISFYDGMQIFDWTGTIYKDRNSDWVLWISSPYEDDDISLY